MIHVNFHFHSLFLSSAKLTIANFLFVFQILMHELIFENLNYQIGMYMYHVYVPCGLWAFQALGLAGFSGCEPYGL